ncbi:MAG: phosphatidylserine decarboxylase [Pseudonocardia sp.]|nr:phosphatidylserine decarboxylase [Pseudonocardia sp.]
MTERDPGHSARADPSSAHEPTGLGHYVGLVRDAIPPMHPGGRPIVAGVGAAALLARLLTGRGALIGLAATAAVAAFFREPARVTPDRAGVIVAPADGTVAAVEDAGPPTELGLPATPLPRVSVFLSVLDVHVQRIPCDGRVERVVYRPGKFLSADLDKASDDNERSSMLLRTTDGHRIGVVQIAGLLARRIVCQVGEGAEVAAGETYGLIRFGSRVDTYLPAGSPVLVAPGQRVIGGETVLAELPADRDPHRQESNPQQQSAHPAPPVCEAAAEAGTSPGEA